MLARIPALAALLGSAVLFAAIAFVFVLVILSLFVGNVDFAGEPKVADAEALAGFVLAS